MKEVKTFKMEQKFNGVEELYKFLRKNTDTLENLTGIETQEPLKERPYCLTAKEKITERQIMLYASQEAMPENIGELIVLAAAFDADIVIFLIKKINPTILEPMNWLHKICNEDIQIILGEGEF